MSGSLKTLRDVVSILARTTTSDLRTFEAWESTIADTTLTVACEGILSGKAVAARALVRLVTTVNFGVTLQIVLSNEALATVVALEYPSSRSDPSR